EKIPPCTSALSCAGAQPRQERGKLTLASSPSSGGVGTPAVSLPGAPCLRDTRPLSGQMFPLSHALVLLILCFHPLVMLGSRDTPHTHLFTQKAVGLLSSGVIEFSLFIATSLLARCRGTLVPKQKSFLWSDRGWRGGGLRCPGVTRHWGGSSAGVPPLPG
uniref:Uncharacterized protein n=1 Tax=Athene cunicularia TaxID=194338 RepID=A0A663NDN0_ATHCN